MTAAASLQVSGTQPGGSDGARAGRAQTSLQRIPAWAAGLLFALAALLTRWQVLGDPVASGLDDQFYVLVANRMFEGAVPYIDIWDRKPIGLFLLYAASKVLGGNVQLGSALLALACVTGTAFILFRLARRVASDLSAVAIGLIYIEWLILSGGEGGQSPVYYNLLVAGAVAIYVSARDRPAAQRGDFRLPGILVMLLIGVGLQIKYTVLFEGMFLGLALLVSAWRGGRRPAALALDASIWVACALLPTALAAAGYGLAGHFDAWLFANFTSISMRQAEPQIVVLRRLFVMLLLLAPLGAGWLLRILIVPRPADPRKARDLRVLDLWAASAVFGVAVFGTWFLHYALPLLAPLALVLAPLGSRRLGRALLVLILGSGAVVGQLLTTIHIAQRGDKIMLASAAAASRGARNCIFVFDGPTLLYDAANSCLPSRHPFPEHLKAVNEAGATGIDQVTELKRIMAARPDRVMMRAPASQGENPVARAVVVDALRRNYVETWRYHVVGRDFVIFTPRDKVPAGYVPKSAGNLIGSVCEPGEAAVAASRVSPVADPLGWVAARLAPLMGACM